MITYLGDFKEDASVYIMFNTFSSDDPSASCTITNFANTDVHIHKDDGLTQRNNAAGITVSVDFDGIIGSHLVKVDTSDDTVAGFWVTGHEYFVRIEGTTIDGATINSVIGQFSLESRFNEVDVTQWLGTAAATPTVAGVPEVDPTHWKGSALVAANVPGTPLVDLGRIDGSTAWLNYFVDFLTNCYDSANNLVPVNVTHLLGTAWLTPGVAGTPDANAKQIGGTAQTGNDVGADVNEILIDTAVIGAAGAGLTDLGGMSTGMKTEVESEANDALIAVHLDHLLAVDYDPAAKPGIATALLNELVENDGGVSRYTANALEQAPSGGTNPNVLADTTLTLTDQTHFVLAAGSNDDDAYLDQAIVLYDASDSDFPSVRKVADYVGATRTITLDSAPDFTMTTGDGVKIFVTAPGTSAPTVGQIRVEMEGAGYKLALIEADTNELQLNQGNWATAVVTALSAQGKLDVNAECDTALGDMFTSSAQLVDDIWDELLTAAAHNVATSAGRRMRELGAYHITSGTAQAGAAYSITLAAAETAGDHILNRNLIVILAGTGVGQTRTIVDYTSSSKIAVVDRDWITNPDNTSEYTIIPDDTPLVANHGVATAGTSTTITIAATASAINSTYANSIIQIMAGTGAGQSQLIDSYNGTTKVVTVCDTWTTTPDNTSVYVILPYGVSNVCNIGTDALALIKAECDTALIDYDSPTRAEATTDKNAIIAEIDANEIKIDALNDITVADIIAGIADGTYDFQEMMRLIFAESCGKASGGGTSTVTFRNPADTKDRIVATVDEDGNRDPTTRDGS